MSVLMKSSSILRAKQQHSFKLHISGISSPSTPSWLSHISASLKVSWVGLSDMQSAMASDSGSRLEYIVIMACDYTALSSYTHYITPPHLSRYSNTNWQKLLLKFQLILLVSCVSCARVQILAISWVSIHFSWLILAHQILSWLWSGQRHSFPLQHSTHSRY